MKRTVRNAYWCVALVALFTIAGTASTLQVGPGKQYSTPCKAIQAAQAGDTIEIDGGTTYSGDVCGWNTSSLTIRGVNGRPIINANGMNYAGKGTWDIAADNTTIENVEMLGAAVPDHNGAAIRFEGGKLTLRYAYIHNNEDGILTSNNGTSDITIEYSEFANNGYGDGQTHNLYIGDVKSLTFRFNYSHLAKVGHLLKSRAATNYILYNRLSDESTGTASYELDLPNGGRSYVIGNLIQQGPATQNSVMLAYMEEGAGSGGTDLYVVNNTFVNRYSSGTFMNIASGASAAVIKNNIFYGPGAITNQSSAVKSNNLNVTTNPGFVNLAGYDYHLNSGSAAIDAGTAPGTGAGYALTPTFQYVHPACGEGRTTVGTIDIGAYEYGGGTGGSTGGTCTTTQEISGNVADASTGKSLQGATVSYSGGSTTTDVSGNYSFGGVPAGSYTLTASASGYQSSSKSATVGTGTSANLSFSLTPTTTTSKGTLTGKVTSASSGAALPGVTVSVNGSTATTNSSGIYTFTGMSSGTYTASFAKSGWLSRTASVSVTSGSTTTFNEKLATAGQAKVSVKNSSGAAIGGATVTLKGGVISTSKTGTTSSTGAYSFGWVPIGTYTLSISMSGYTSQSKSLTVSSGQTTTVSVTLQ